MIKTIILDLGGVIVSPKIEKINDMIAEHIGIDISQFNEFIFNYRSDLTKGKISLFEVYSKLIKKFNLVKFSNQDVLDKHLEIFQEKINDLNEEIISLLKKLRENYLVICLVNTELDVVPLVKKRGVYDYFKHAYISTQMGMEKPDAEIYQTVLNEIKCKPEEVIFIDDKKENVDAAKRLGIIGIHYKWGDDLEKELRLILDCV